MLLKTYSNLDDAVSSSFPANKPLSTLGQKLSKNVYLFSGAKSAQEMLLFSSLLTNENGQKRTFTDFKNEILKAHKEYNINHLKAEYFTAQSSAAAAVDWERFQRQKGKYPHLQYLSLADGRVRKDHEDIHGTIKHIDDPWWDTHYPPNGWRCRCYVKQTNDPTTDNTPEITITTGFQNNVGKSGELFNTSDKNTGEAIKHPYFQLPKAKLSALKEAFKVYQRENPQYIKTSFKNILVSRWTDMSEFDYNLERGSIGVKTLKKGDTLYIQPDVQDGAKNPELRITGDKIDWIGDIKGIDKKGSWYNQIESAKEQKCDFVFYDISTDYDDFKSDYETFARRKYSEKADYYKSIKMLVFIKGNKAIKKTRKEIIELMRKDGELKFLNDL